MEATVLNFFFVLIVVLLATSVEGFQKNWVWSNNWDNPDNWDLERLPCSRDRIIVGNVRFICVTNRSSAPRQNVKISAKLSSLYAALLLISLLLANVAILPMLRLNVFTSCCVTLN